MRGCKLAFWVKQRELLDFLVCGKQIALHAVGKKAQRLLALLPAAYALALLLQALRNPARQGGALYRVDGNTCAALLKRGKPCAAFGGFVQARQSHQQQRIGVGAAFLRQLLQHGGPVFAWLACRYVDFNDLPR